MRAFWTSAVIGLGMISSVVQAQDAVLPDGAGRDQINKACSVCHSVTQVTSQRHTRAEWADLVDQMVARGAQVSDNDYKTIVDYLGKNFAPAAAPAAPPAGGAKGK